MKKKNSSKKTLEQKYLDLLESQVHLLEKHVEAQDERIAQLEQEATLNRPFQGVPISYPGIVTTPFTSPTQCLHDFPLAWSNTGPRICTKCGCMEYTYGQGTVVSINGTAGSSVSNITNNPGVAVSKTFNSNHLLLDTEETAVN